MRMAALSIGKGSGDSSACAGHFLTYHTVRELLMCFPAAVASFKTPMLLNIARYGSSVTSIFEQPRRRGSFRRYCAEASTFFGGRQLTITREGGAASASLSRTMRKRSPTASYI